MDQAFADALEKMRNDIHASTATALATFQKQTGMTPSAVKIDMIETTTVGDRRAVFVLGPVRFRFDDQ